MDETLGEYASYPIVQLVHPILQIGITLQIEPINLKQFSCCRIPSYLTHRCLHLAYQFGKGFECVRTS